MEAFLIIGVASLLGLVLINIWVFAALTARPKEQGAQVQQETNPMRRSARTLMLLGPLLLFTTISRAHGGSQPVAAGKSGVVALLVGDSTVGGKVLAKGYYQVRCEHRGGTHALVFRKVTYTALVPPVPSGVPLHPSIYPSLRPQRFTRASGRWGKEMAKAQCKMEDLERKVDRTSLLGQRRQAGLLKVQEIRIEGESVRHVLE